MAIRPKPKERIAVRSIKEQSSVFEHQFAKVHRVIGGDFTRGGATLPSELDEDERKGV